MRVRRLEVSAKAPVRWSHSAAQFVTRIAPLRLGNARGLVQYPTGATHHPSSTGRCGRAQTRQSGRSRIAALRAA